jgi:hypothetical protein
MEERREYLTRAEVVAEYPLSDSFLCKASMDPAKRPFAGPPYIRRGRKIIYRRRDVEAWLDAQTVEQPRKQGRPTKAEQVMRQRMKESLSG